MGLEEMQSVAWVCIYLGLGLLFLLWVVFIGVFIVGMSKDYRGFLTLHGQKFDPWMYAKIIGNCVIWPVWFFVHREAILEELDKQKERKR